MADEVGYGAFRDQQRRNFAGAYVAAGLAAVALDNFRTPTRAPARERDPVISPAQKLFNKYRVRNNLNSYHRPGNLVRQKVWRRSDRTRKTRRTSGRKRRFRFRV